MMKRQDPTPNFWHLQTAKTCFTEVIKRAQAVGPQHIIVHGRDEVVVMSIEDFRRLTGEVTGEALIKAIQSSPYREVDIEPPRVAMQQRRRL